MNKILYCFIIFILNCLSACSKDNREVRYKEFPIEIYLKGEIIHIDDTIHHSYPLLTIIEDKLVILDFAAEEYYYHVYGIEEFEYKYSFGKKGRGLNEMLYAQSLVHQDSFMYIDNGNDRSKIIKFVIRESEAVAVDTINTPKEFGALNYTINNNEIWGVPYSGSSYRAVKINKNSQTTDSILKVPDTPEGFMVNPSYTWGSSIAQKNNLIVLATHGGERLDIYNERTKTNKTIIGPGGNPTPDIRGENIHLDSKIIGFWNIQLIDSLIYTSYCGQNYQETIWNNLDEVYSIQIYSLNGDPIKKIHLDKIITSFYFNEKDGHLYTTAITGEEQECIVRYKL